jgi:hypothetical protein
VFYTALWWSSEKLEARELPDMPLLALGKILILIAIVALRGLGYFMHGNMGVQLFIGVAGLHHIIAW